VFRRERRAFPLSGSETPHGFRSKDRGPGEGLTLAHVSTLPKNAQVQIKSVEGINSFILSALRERMPSTAPRPAVFHCGGGPRRTPQPPPPGQSEAGTVPPRMPWKAWGRPPRPRNGSTCTTRCGRDDRVNFFLRPPAFTVSTRKSSKKEVRTYLAHSASRNDLNYLFRGDAGEMTVGPYVFGRRGDKPRSSVSCGPLPPRRRLPIKKTAATNVSPRVYSGRELESEPPTAPP